MGGFGAEPGQVQQGSGKSSGEGLGGFVQSQVSFNRVPEKVSEKVRFNRMCGHLSQENPADVFPALGFAARFRKICRHEMLRLLGIPHFFSYSSVAVREPPSAICN